MAAGASVAQQRWELENAVASTSASEADGLYRYDLQEQQTIQQQKPWQKDPQYFKHVRMSALALLKMAIHARSGGNLEVMGLMQGKVQGDTFVVIDSFALPVEGTETRVNAQAEAYEYMVDFVDSTKCVGRPENVVGWYHSHPGYGCWLSGIDCSTQMLNQQFQEPFLAVVVDPVRTMASGKVEIGAFRTYPEGYKPPDEGPSEYQTIPLSKIEDFGVHAKQYYSLDITFFKSSLDAALLDLLWNSYWVNTLSASPLVGNREYTAGGISDVAEKLEQAESTLSQGARMGRYVGAAAASGKKGGGGGDEGPLNKICRDVGKLSAEQVKGLSSQLVKALLFNCNPLQQAAAAAAQAGGGDGAGDGSGAGAAAVSEQAGGEEAPMET
ncbi:COP9 signalosome complex subunit 5 [Monoraphidium neglectum]|uniref:COP9 signalosome complex subunit 5 n=1 Tax=Monoraphidium neglectum TaxID=145388 RepID=A0A0D2K9J6_9CHLO|nr:COP9 signalosome complex subunit 5 [Monoraphidium neglectum]KIZ06923.1 COP9 signalosome complex subunit 5 [Monoraphidium neglectum]|eukprot:XP_013905942.1 COP9 signalosome complex subunit 5 [Monoraphidium neglectum]